MEVMAALVILTIFILPFFNIFYQGFSITAENRVKEKSLQLAVNKMESLKIVSFNLLEKENRQNIVDIDGRKYMKKVTVKRESPFLKKIIITISYQESYQEILSLTAKRSLSKKDKRVKGDE